MSVDHYPMRDSHFAHRVVRMLQKTCAASEIGHVACLLVTYVAHTEDALHYSAPVRFWNVELMSSLGLSSPKQLNIARQKAVDAGWLVYTREGNRQIGKYWVTIPLEFAELSDRLIESIHSPDGTNKGTIEGMNNGTNAGTNEPTIVAPEERITERIVSNSFPQGNDKVTNSGTKSGKHSIPIPNPNPPPPTPKGERAAAADLLLRRKVEFPNPALSAAFRAGATLADIRGIVEHFDSRPGAWTPAALQSRVKNWLPGQSPNDGWPTPSKQFEADQASQRKSERDAADKQKRDQEAKAKRMELDRLERDHGAKINGMSDAELRAFVQAYDSSNVFKQQLNKRGRDDPGVRIFVLKRLAEAARWS